jgi:HPt (histidine-containing phosphotransfer) domain-containing protein
MEILNEHKLKYLNRRMVEIKELKESLMNDDYEIAITIGHRLKGNGETFGYPRISSIGITLEQAALARNKEMLRTTIDELAQNVEENLKNIQ